MPLVHGGYLTVGPINDQPAFQVEWTYEVIEEKEAEAAKQQKPVKELNVEEQAWLDVQAYFKEQGKSVPSAEAKWCLDAIRMEKLRLKEALDAPPAPVTEVMPERPEYGTREFWAWCAKTKKQREAAKKAKEDEKEQKRKAKEHEKQAKALEKIQKRASSSPTNKKSAK